MLPSPSRPVRCAEPVPHRGLPSQTVAPPSQPLPCDGPPARMPLHTPALQSPGARRISSCSEGPTTPTYSQLASLSLCTDQLVPWDGSRNLVLLLSEPPPSNVSLHQVDTCPKISVRRYPLECYLLCSPPSQHGNNLNVQQKAHK